MPGCGGKAGRGAGQAEQFFWCPLPECLESLESYSNLQLLTQHQRTHHGLDLPSHSWTDVAEWSQLAADRREAYPVSCADALSVAATVAPADSSERATAIKELAAVLVAAAAATIVPATVRDLTCVQCHSMLFQPVTMSDGNSVCTACVAKYSSPPRPGWYGGAVNVTLQAIALQCMPAASRAAALRIEGNEAFKQGLHQQAIELYTQALEHCSSDSGALCSNRYYIALSVSGIDLACLQVPRTPQAVRRAGLSPRCRPCDCCGSRLGEALV